MKWFEISRSAESSRMQSLVWCCFIALLIPSSEAGIVAFKNTVTVNRPLRQAVRPASPSNTQKLGIQDAPAPYTTVVDNSPGTGTNVPAPVGVDTETFAASATRTSLPTTSARASTSTATLASSSSTSSLVLTTSRISTTTTSPSPTQTVRVFSNRNAQPNRRDVNLIPADKNARFVSSGTSPSPSGTVSFNTMVSIDPQTSRGRYCCKTSSSRAICSEAYDKCRMEEGMVKCGLFVNINDKPNTPLVAGMFENPSLANLATCSRSNPNNDPRNLVLVNS